MAKFLSVFIKHALVGVLVALLISVVSSCFGAYSVGVKAGDWVKYQVTTSGIGSDEFLGFSQADWVKGEILSVSGTSVTAQMTARYTNGSEQVQTLVGDVATGSGNLTFMLVPAGLEKGDSVPVAMFGPVQTGLVFNDTVSRTYAGASRSVNVFSMSISEDFATVEVQAYWDQVTGVLMELFMYASTVGNTVEVGVKATETNMWSAGGFLGGGDPLNNLLFMGGVVAAVTAVAVVAVVLFTRRPSPMPAPVPVPVPA